MEASDGIELQGAYAEEKQAWIEEVLIRFGYLGLKRGQKGMMRKYIQKISGYGLPPKQSIMVMGGRE